MKVEYQHTAQGEVKVGGKSIWLTAPYYGFIEIAGLTDCDTMAVKRAVRSARCMIDIYHDPVLVKNDKRLREAVAVLMALRQRGDVEQLSETGWRMYETAYRNRFSDYGLQEASLLKDVYR